MAASRRHRVDPHVRHRDVAGGPLRPAVFGASDGLVSNVALVLGVAGAAAPDRVVLVAGLAGLLAGAFSMATGEYVSVRSQQEMIDAELRLERRELQHAPEAEEAELAAIYRTRGLSVELAGAVARELSRDPEVALRVHAREELGVDPDRPTSPWTAAATSFAAFAVGAVVPLLGYLLDAGAPAATAAGLGAAGLAALGAASSRYTTRSAPYAALRQLLLGAAAAGVTYVTGAAIGAT